MMDAIIKTFRYIWLQKFKILFTLVFTLVFLFILFPFKDLNDFVSGQVSKLTQNSVYLQFEDMHINPVTASISLETKSPVCGAGDICKPPEDSR